MYQGRPESGAMTGTYDTTDTAGVTARFGRVQDTAPVFDIPDVPPDGAVAGPGE
jgi:hypothetical protein